MSKRKALLLFLGDPSTDRRVQNFRRLFEQSGWEVELLALTTSHAGGPRKFVEYHRALSKVVRSKRVDVVMACDLYSLTAATELRKRGRARIAIYDAREIYTELPSVAKKPAVKRVWKRLERRGLAESDLILVTAPHDLQAILDVHGFVPRSLLIRNLPWLDSALTRDRSLLGRFAIPADTVVFVYVGGLQEGRGLEQFFRAMKEEEIHLLLIGDGKLKSSLEQLATERGISDRVHFAGAVESGQALKLAAACDAGVVLVESVSKSYELALPSKVFEYMMAGLPILASTMRHVTELFEKEEWIFFADVNDESSIREGIHRVIGATQDAQLRTREQSLSLERFHFERDASALISLLEQKLASP